jgi:hypothetical protein
MEAILTKVDLPFVLQGFWSPVKKSKILKIIIIENKNNDENKERVHPIDSTLRTSIVLIDPVQQGKFTM